MLSANLKAERKKIGISQEELAARADLSVQAINSIEGCRCWVSDKTLAKIADVFHVEAFQLLAPYAPLTQNSNDAVPFYSLDALRQNIKADIDERFSRLSAKAQNM
jgi:transcriptional regulator with XRE-family HTH domain